MKQWLKLVGILLLSCALNDVLLRAFDWSGTSWCVGYITGIIVMSIRTLEEI